MRNPKVALYENLRDGYYVVAVTCMGKDGRMIGIVTDPKNTSIPKGVIVLFSNPPPQPNMTIACYDFETRQSQKGKTYVKCFGWCGLEELGKLKEELRKRIVSEKVESIAAAIPERYRDAIRRFLLTGEVPKIDAVVFYAGVVPIREPNDDAYVALVDRDGKIYEGGAAWGEPKAIVPDGMHVMRIYESVEMPGVQVVNVLGYHFAIVQSEKLAKALRELEVLSLPSDMRRKIVQRLIELVSGGNR